MSELAALNSRQQQILCATVRHYIATAEPVGSRTLVEEYDLRVSPATIRSSMGVLERAGLLYQPHVSAGRIPSDSGYRFYVDDWVVPSPEVAVRVEQLLGDRLNWDSWSLEALLRGAAQILATLSGYITLITLPQTSTARLRHLQLVRVDDRRVMAIVVTDTYQTQSAVLELYAGETEETDSDRIEGELQILSNFLTEQLREKQLSELANLDWNELDRQFQRYADVLKRGLTELISCFHAAPRSDLLVSGVSEVLRQPEFARVDRVQTLIHLLEDEPDRLLPLIFETCDDRGKRVTVRIGAENHLEPIRTCALVSATYQRESVPVGSVGVLGPTRMVYENAIAVVEAAADYLSDAIAQFN